MSPHDPNCSTTPGWDALQGSRSLTVITRMHRYGFSSWVLPEKMIPLHTPAPPAKSCLMEMMLPQATAPQPRKSLRETVASPELETPTNLPLTMKSQRMSFSLRLQGTWASPPTGQVAWQEQIPQTLPGCFPELMLSKVPADDPTEWHSAEINIYLK